MAIKLTPAQLEGAGRTAAELDGKPVKRETIATEKLVVEAAKKLNIQEGSEVFNLFASAVFVARNAKGNLLEQLPFTNEQLKPVKKALASTISGVLEEVILLPIEEQEKIPGLIEWIGEKKIAQLGQLEEVLKGNKELLDNKAIEGVVEVVFGGLQNIPNEVPAELKPCATSFARIVAGKKDEVKRFLIEANKLDKLVPLDQLGLEQLRTSQPGREDSAPPGKVSKPDTPKPEEIPTGKVFDKAAAIAAAPLNVEVILKKGTDGKYRGEKDLGLIELAEKDTSKFGTVSNSEDRLAGIKDGIEYEFVFEGSDSVTNVKLKLASDKPLSSPLCLFKDVEIDQGVNQDGHDVSIRNKGSVTVKTVEDSGGTGKTGGSGDGDGKPITHTVKLKKGQEIELTLPDGVSNVNFDVLKRGLTKADVTQGQDGKIKIKAKDDFEAIKVKVPAQKEGRSVEVEFDFKIGGWGPYIQYGAAGLLALVGIGFFAKSEETGGKVAGGLAIIGGVVVAAWNWIAGLIWKDDKKP